MTPKVNLQTRTANALSELGEKIFLDRYAVKDIKRETLAVGDTVVVLVNPKTGQRDVRPRRGSHANDDFAEVRA